MANLTCLLLSPILLLVSIPLTIFAALTSALAFSTLSVHVIIVYAELAAVLIRNQFSDAAVSPKSYSKSETCTAAAAAASGGNSTAGSMTPKVPESSSGLGIFSSGGMMERDFEGIGGWRVPGSDDDDILWTSMNSRLELPAIVDNNNRKKRHHHHQRSLTSGSSVSSRPLITRSSTRSLRKTFPIAAHTTGDADAGSAEYFFDAARANPKSVISAVDAAANANNTTRRSSICRKTSSTSMFSSSDGSIWPLQTKSPQV